MTSHGLVPIELRACIGRIGKTIEHLRQDKRMTNDQIYEKQELNLRNSRTYFQIYLRVSNSCQNFVDHSTAICTKLDFPRVQRVVLLTWPRQISEQNSVHIINDRREQARTTSYDDHDDFLGHRRQVIDQVDLLFREVSADCVLANTLTYSRITYKSSISFFISAPGGSPIATTTTSA